MIKYIFLIFAIFFSTCQPIHENTTTLQDSKVKIEMLKDSVASYKSIKKPKFIYNENNIKSCIKLNDIDETEYTTNTVIKPLPSKSIIRKSVQIKSTTLPKVKSIIIEKTKIETTNISGSVFYYIPKVMEVGNTYRLYVRISKSKILINEYKAETLIKSAVIPVTDVMDVEIKDPSPENDKSFSVVAENKSMQFLNNDSSYTQWNWSVMPLRSGNNSLILIISITKDNIPNQKVYEDVILVKTSFINQGIYCIKKYWQILFTSVLIPFIAFLWKLRKKNNDKKERI